MRTAKAARSLQGIADGTSRELGFLVLSGSFNPIHQGHMRVLHVARTKCSHDGVGIIAGFLAPSSDEYVSAKLGGQAWPLRFRSQLCAVAAAESDWIDVWDSGQMSGFRVCGEILEQLREHYTCLLKGHRGDGDGYCN
jgi:nicotinic acid mononucleotide adenylyltransferase